MRHLSTRRRLLAAALGAIAIPVKNVRGQPPPKPKRVVLFSPSGPVPETAALAENLRLRRSLWAKHGMVEGRDYYEHRVTATVEDSAENERIAREVVASRPDLIMTRGEMNVTIFQRLTHEIPIVFHFVSDPVASGIVKSLRAPGRNATGFALGFPERAKVLLGLIREIRPGARKVALLDDAANKRPLDNLRDAAAQAGLGSIVITDADTLGLDALEGAVRSAGVDAIIIGRRRELVSLQGRTGVPGFSLWNPHLTPDALASLGLAEHLENHAEEAIKMAVQILRGADPAITPVRQPSRWWLGVNLKTARALGIEIPPSILVRADEIVR